MFFCTPVFIFSSLLPSDIYSYFFRKSLRHIWSLVKKLSLPIIFFCQGCSKLHSKPAGYDFSISETITIKFIWPEYQLLPNIAESNLIVYMGGTRKRTLLVCSSFSFIQITPVDIIILYTHYNRFQGVTHSLFTTGRVPAGTVSYYPAVKQTYSCGGGGGEGEGRSPLPSPVPSLHCQSAAQLPPVINFECPLLLHTVYLPIHNRASFWRTDDKLL